MELTDRISEAARRAISDRVFPGCVVAAAWKDGRRIMLPFGRLTYEETSPAVTPDTMYDVASVTKSVPTGSIALQLVEEGAMSLDAKLIAYLPEFRNGDRDLVLVRHLLTYALDGYGMASLKDRTAAGLREALLTRDFDRRPGTVFQYSNIPAALLGLAIEHVTGETLDALAQGRFFTPLGMTSTTFFPERFGARDVAPTEVDGWRGLVQGKVHDESAYVCKEAGVLVGHAGLFSTAPDLLAFMEMLLHGGERGGRRYFSEATVAQMGENQIAHLGDFTGLGWELNQPRYMGDRCTPHTFGKTGFTGALCVCDAAKGVTYVILSNRTFPRRPADSAAINGFRKAVGEILLGGA